MGLPEITGKSRASLVLLHPTSLPDPPGAALGVGELGSEAVRFIDFLADSGTLVWQVLPLGHTGFGDSPYQTFSRYAGSPLLISVERLRDCGDVTAEEFDAYARSVRESCIPPGRVDYGWLHNNKIGADRHDAHAVLRLAFERFSRRMVSDPRREALGRFEAEYGARWLDNYAEFMALKEHFGGRPWSAWSEPCRSVERWREEHVRLIEKHPELARAIDFYKYLQFCFFEQWFALREHARRRGRLLVGDMPWYVGYDSADVWARPEVFDLDDEGRPNYVAGVPPDYFSPTGQLWGNPVYDWSRPETFAWWADAVDFILTQVDVLRVDHFRAIDTWWRIPRDWAEAEGTAVRGEWAAGPGARLLDALTDRLVDTGRVGAKGQLPFIAEDLGFLDPLRPSPQDYPKSVGEDRRHPVEKTFAERMKKKDPSLGAAFDPKTLEYSTRKGVDLLLEQYQLPWMAVLQFSLEDSDDPLGHVVENCVAYTGTHDNDTSQGWCRETFYRRRADVDRMLAEWEDRREERAAEAERLAHEARMRRDNGEAPREDAEAAPARFERPMLVTERIDWMLHPERWRDLPEDWAERVPADVPYDAARKMLAIVMRSEARLAGGPLQDCLCLGTEARMNRPGDTSGGWWTWRATREQLDYAWLAGWLRGLNEATERLAP